MNCEITQAELMKRLDYNPDTGIFRWKVNRGCVVPGKIAGTPNGKGYLTVRLNKKNYLLHRLAWLYIHGTWPKHFIDHADMDRANNRLANLREATKSQNHANRRTANRNGFKGVARTPGGRFIASLDSERKTHYLGTFDSAEEAGEAYKAAATRIHGQFARW